MFVSLYVYGAEFQMLHHESLEKAKEEMLENVKDNFKPDEDEGIIMEIIPGEKEMKLVYNVREDMEI